MSAAMRARALSPTGLLLWQRCPREFWFEHVVQATPDPTPNGFAALLALAGHAGLATLITEPDASRERLRDVLYAAFQHELQRSQAKGFHHALEGIDRTLDRLETEVLDLVLQVGLDERVRKIEWTHTGVRAEWALDGSRRLGVTIEAAGVAREQIEDFGRSDGERTTLEPGTRVLVNWKFGRKIDVSPLALALHVQLALYGLGAAELWPDEPRPRLFLGVVRDQLPRRPSDARGKPLARLLRELNPEYLAAFAGSEPVTAEIRETARTSRRRFSTGGRAVPKYLERPNPDYDRQVGLPRGPVFHEARTAWRVVLPAIEATVREVELATRVGTESAFPARGRSNGRVRSLPVPPPVRRVVGSRRRLSALSAPTPQPTISHPSKGPAMTPERLDRLPGEDDHDHGLDPARRRAHRRSPSPRSPTSRSASLPRRTRSACRRARCS